MNSYYTIRKTIVWIRTKTTPCTNLYYTICITIVWIRLHEFVQKPHCVRIHTIQLLAKKNCIQVGISTGDQYHSCNRRCVCHPTPHLLRQWPFYLYTGQLRKPSKKRDCTNSFVLHSQSHSAKSPSEKMTIENMPRGWALEVPGRNGQFLLTF